MSTSTVARGPYSTRRGRSSSGLFPPRPSATTSPTGSRGRRRTRARPWTSFSTWFEGTRRGRCSSTATAESFDQALAQVDRETKERFEGTWQALAGNANKRRVLKALALSNETLYNKRTLQAFGLNKSKAQSGEKGLIGEGEVVRIDGRPAIIDPLLERWIALRARP